jgi:hypothetical protein
MPGSAKDNVLAGVGYLWLAFVIRSHQSGDVNQDVARGLVSCKRMGRHDDLLIEFVWTHWCAMTGGMEDQEHISLFGTI